MYSTLAGEMTIDEQQQQPDNNNDRSDQSINEDLVLHCIVAAAHEVLTDRKKISHLLYIKHRLQSIT